MLFHTQIAKLRRSVPLVLFLRRHHFLFTQLSAFSSRKTTSRVPRPTKTWNTQTIVRNIPTALRKKSDHSHNSVYSTSTVTLTVTDKEPPANHTSICRRARGQSVYLLLQRAHVKALSDILIRTRNWPLAVHRRRRRKERLRPWTCWMTWCTLEISRGVCKQGARATKELYRLTTIRDVVVTGCDVSPPTRFCSHLVCGLKCT